MAFDALDAQLRQLQGNIVSKSNQGLLYGGTTKSEYDFLSKAALDNTTGPNFYSFMAGISAGNLAQQEAQQQQYDRAKELRDLDSQLTYRDAQTRLTHANAAGQEATNPYIPDAQQADIGYKRGQTDLTAANAIQQYNANPYVADAAQADIGYKRGQTDLTAANAIQQYNANPYVADAAQADINYKRSQAELSSANAVAQQEVNPYLAYAQKLENEKQDIANTYAGMNSRADLETKRLQNMYYPETQAALIGKNEASAAKSTGYSGMTMGEAAKLAAQQKAAQATAAPPSPTSVGGKQAPVLRQGIDAPLRNTVLQLEANPSYVPNPVEQQAMREYQAYIAAGGIPLKLR